MPYICALLCMQRRTESDGMNKIGEDRLDISLGPGVNFWKSGLTLHSLHSLYPKFSSRNNIFSFILPSYHHSFHSTFLLFSLNFNFSYSSFSSQSLSLPSLSLTLHILYPPFSSPFIHIINILLHLILPSIPCPKSFLSLSFQLTFLIPHLLYLSPSIPFTLLTPDPSFL